MRNVRSIIFFLPLLFTLLFPKEDETGKRLKAEFDALIKISNLNPKKIGIVIYSLDKREFIFTHNKRKPLIPASNQKLLVSSCGLSLWNESFKRYLSERLKKRRSIQKSYLFRRLNSRSDNQLAEAVFKAIGRYKRSSPAAAIRNYLRRRKIPTAGLVIADGSGWSRENRATTLTYVQLLNFLYHSSHKRDFLRSLAVAGRRGTLKGRLLSLRGRVYAKTGHIRNVNTLSGYLFSPKGNYSFSIIINDKRPNLSNWEFIERLLSCLI